MVCKYLKMYGERLYIVFIWISQNCLKYWITWTDAFGKFLWRRAFDGLEITVYLSEAGRNSTYTMINN